MNDDDKKPDEVEHHCFHDSVKHKPTVADILDIPSGRANNHRRKDIVIIDGGSGYLPYANISGKSGLMADRIHDAMRIAVTLPSGKTISPADFADQRR